MVMRQLIYLFSDSLASLSNVTVFSKQVTRILYIVVGFCILLLLASGIHFAYSSYKYHQEQKAQTALAHCLAEYQKISQDNAADCHSFAALTKTNYQKYSSCKIAPYFLSLHADALLKQNRYDDAVMALRQASAQTASTLPLSGFLQLKYTLLLLDSSNKEQAQEGLQLLVKLATSDKLIGNDAAQYHLGQYYYAHGMLDEARQVLQNLIESQWQEKIAPSPWASRAKELLMRFATV